MKIIVIVKKKRKKGKLTFNAFPFPQFHCFVQNIHSIGHFIHNKANQNRMVNWIPFHSDSKFMARSFIFIASDSFFYVVAKSKRIWNLLIISIIWADEKLNQFSQINLNINSRVFFWWLKKLNLNFFFNFWILKWNSLEAVLLLMGLGCKLFAKVFPIRKSDIGWDLNFEVATY